MLNFIRLSSIYRRILTDQRTSLNEEILTAFLSIVNIPNPQFPNPQTYIFKLLIYVMFYFNFIENY